MSDSVRPIDGSPPGSVPGILQARTLEWVAISFSNAWKWKVKVKSLSRVRLLVTPWTAAFQAPPSMGFSRQEYWSGMPLPSPLFSWPLNNYEMPLFSLVMHLVSKPIESYNSIATPVYLCWILHGISFSISFYLQTFCILRVKVCLLLLIVYDWGLSTLYSRLCFVHYPVNVIINKVEYKFSLYYSFCWSHLFFIPSSLLSSPLWN